MSNFAICRVGVAPLRAQPSDRSEQVSQVLFGETLEMLEWRRKWAQVRCTWDGYEGWMDTKQAQPISEAACQMAQQHYAVNLEWMQPAQGTQQHLPLPMGATLPQFDGLHFQFLEQRYTFSGQAIVPGQAAPTPSLVSKLARRYLFAPYLWGGRSPFGIDCSGFTQNVFRMLGVALPRNANQQVYLGETVHFVELAQMGDLAFFENESGRIVHVGIVLDEGQIIHAHGHVRLDKLDHFGIFNLEQDRYSHRLRIIKRVLPSFGRSTASSKSGSANNLADTQIRIF